ncbi:hypothetical protein CAPI_04640 [Corynebacterium capitovis DSM 44611]|nr:hypothetical protein CAPI_04640 [Corynebacterium capitovis DSM 44611]
MQSPAPGAELALQDIRTGSHEGFDRVVFEFSGTGVPGFIAGYTAEPRQQASGYPLDVAGSAYLQVMVQGTPMGMTSATTALDTPGRLDVAPAGSIVGLSSGGTFEADTQFVIGLDAQRPFRAYTLENPTRVVVDVETTA